MHTVLDEEDNGSGGGGGSGSGGRSNSKGGKAAAPTPQEQQEELAAQALALARRGGEAALQGMARQAGSQLQQRLPKLWELVWAPLAAVQQQGVAADLQAAVQALHVLAVLAPAVHADLAPQLDALLPLVALCLQHANAALQLAAARAVAALAEAHTQTVMPPILRLLGPLLVGELLAKGKQAQPSLFGGRVALGCKTHMSTALLSGDCNSSNLVQCSGRPICVLATHLHPLAGGAPDAARLGALLALHQSVSRLGLSLVPYCLLVVVPLMGRMSDAQPLARELAARTFAAVVALMPLAQVGAGLA